MFRFSLLICLSVLLYDSSANPFKSWGKNADTALQETSFSDEYNEKMTLGLKEAEPLEDLDLANTDIDPSMLLWKVVKHLRQQKYNKPEEDKDKLYHPVEEKFTAGSVLPGAYIQTQHYGQAWKYQEPEEDMDKLYHFQIDHAESKKLDGDLIRDKESTQTGDKDKAEEAEPSGSVMYMSPEEDIDDLHHGHFPSGYVLEAQVMQAFDNILKRVYTEPEEDLDHLYHK